MVTVVLVVSTTTTWVWVGLGLTLAWVLRTRCLVILVVVVVLSSWWVRLLRILRLHGHHEVLDDVSELINVLGIKTRICLILMTLEVLLVFVIFVLEVAVLLDLVVVDVQGLVVQHKVGAVLGSLRLVGSLEANKSVGTLSILSFEYSARFDFTELSKNLSQVLFSFVVEALHIQVASFLG